MSIALAGFDFGFATGNIVHGVVEAPDFDLKEQIDTYWGLIGASVKYSQPETRLLTLDVVFHNFASQAALTTHIAVVRSNIPLDGTLNVDGINWNQTAFKGFNPSGPQQYDGSGYHGWFRRGTLVFRQIAF